MVTVCFSLWPFEIFVPAAGLCVMVEFGKHDASTTTSGTKFGTVILHSVANATVRSAGQMKAGFTKIVWLAELRQPASLVTL